MVSVRATAELSRADCPRSQGLSESDGKKKSGKSITVFTTLVAAESGPAKYAISLNPNWFLNKLIGSKFSMPGNELTRV